METLKGEKDNKNYSHRFATRVDIIFVSVLFTFFKKTLHFVPCLYLPLEFEMNEQIVFNYRHKVIDWR